MRTTLLLTLALFAVGGYQLLGETLPAKMPGAKPAQQTDLELVVTTPKKEYRVGEPIPLELTFRNRASDPTSKYESAKDWTLYLDEDHGLFWNAYSAVAPRTDELDHVRINPYPCSSFVERAVLVPLLANASWSYRWSDLRPHSDWLRKPGRYYARVHYDSTNTSKWPELKEDRSFPIWRGKLVSNTLTITVKK